MKRFFVMVLSLTVLIMGALASIPVSATIDVSNNSDVALAYSNLEKVEQMIGKNTTVIDSVKFNQATPEMKAYLMDIDINPASVGRISYTLDEIGDEKILNIHVLYQVDKNRYASITSSAYVENNNGDYVQVHNTDLFTSFNISSILPSVSVNASDSGSYDKDGLRVYAVIYYESVYAPDYIRPYQASFFYSFLNSSFAIRNWQGTFTVGGILCNVNGSQIEIGSTSYYWTATGYVPSPVEHQAYWVYNQMSSSYCLGMWLNEGMSYDCQFEKLVNGSYVTKYISVYINHY